MTDDGGWELLPQIMTVISSLLAAGSGLLEFGSGVGTARLVKHYRVWSVEDDPEWVGRFGSTYIHAPIVGGWYDLEVLGRELPPVGDYGLVLVDGPALHRGERWRIADHLELLDERALFLVDDVNFAGGRRTADALAESLGRACRMYGPYAHSSRHWQIARRFAVI